MNKSANQWSLVLQREALLLTPWRANFQPFLEKIEAIPIWLQLSGLPIEYLQKDILMRIASAIGQPIKIDNVTLKGQRARFARLCVFWNLNNKVSSGIWINGGGDRFCQAIAFENIPKLCFSCGKVGHLSDVCQKNKTDSRNETEVNRQTETPTTSKGKTNIENLEKNEIFGPWQVVNRRKKSLSRVNSVQGNTNRNKFEALKVLNDQNNTTTDETVAKVKTEEGDTAKNQNAQVSRGFNPFFLKDRHESSTKEAKKQVIDKGKVRKVKDSMVITDDEMDEDLNDSTGPRAGNGRAGGLIIVWKEVLMKVNLLYRRSQTIHVSVAVNGGVKHLKRLASDHRPVLLDTNCFKVFFRKEKRFIFELYWLDYEDISQQIKDCWKRSTHQGLRIEDFDKHLNSLGLALSKWSKEHIGSLEKKS
ncbi:hypothetical protein Cni_G19782 [Canna indica]|uniref:CCHC-type domain-containing protein n=1 Tax=Canna indica TaxID=4628 RepID=A0AAQ3KS08_9LILI|nr:hypothetical protein Cni_G19782 [Canna indica]